MFKELREKKGLTQTKIAKMLKINVGFWSRIEANKADLPIRHFKKTAKMLGISTKRLVDERIEKVAKEIKAQIYARKH